MKGRPTDRQLGPRLLIGLAVLLTAGFIGLPIVAVFHQALARGLESYVRSLGEPDTLHAIRLTVAAALIAVPLNAVFGIAAAWAVVRFRFPGRKILLSLIEVPFSISPIVAGVSLLMLLGAQGPLGGLLAGLDLKLMFAFPGIVLATMFVTAPFVARELIPLMQAQGSEEEEAATTLGAGGWQIFWRVTLPNVKWALLYGLILCNARVMGEFGAVSVVSGNIRGETNTLPLQVELLYHDYNAAGAFAAASVLALLALVTLAIKSWIESRGIESRGGAHARAAARR